MRPMPGPHWSPSTGLSTGNSGIGRSNTYKDFR
jgi:hypothetical protein